MLVPASSQSRVVLLLAVAGGLASLGCERSTSGVNAGGGGVPDPTLLPVASGQAPNGAAYNTLDVPNQPAGFSYSDPVTHVKIWKATSGSVPASNTSAGHGYADGGNP